MPRQYTKLKGKESEVYRLKEDGHTNREIAAYFGVTREQIRGLIKRHNKKERETEQGIPPKRKGRPRIRPLTSDEEIFFISLEGSEGKRKIFSNIQSQGKVCNTDDV